MPSSCSSFVADGGRYDVASRPPRRARQLEPIATPWPKKMPDRADPSRTDGVTAGAPRRRGQSVQKCGHSGTSGCNRRCWRSARAGARIVPGTSSWAHGSEKFRCTPFPRDSCRGNGRLDCEARACRVAWRTLRTGRTSALDAPWLDASSWSEGENRPSVPGPGDRVVPELQLQRHWAESVVLVGHCEDVGSAGSD
jgi:hypothetical protein